MSIDDYRSIDLYQASFVYRISVEESIMLRERIFREESLRTVRDNGLMAGFIEMICCGKDNTL